MTMTTPPPATTRTAAASARALVTGLALALLLAGCTATPAPTPTFGLGDQAVAIAKAVPACRAASAQTVAPNTPGVASIATCLITGSQVDFIVWTDAEAQTTNGPTTPGNLSGETYVAHGDGWDALAHDSEGRVGLAQNVATTVAKAAGGRVVHVAAP